jgi:predicted heme/steroid binding protein
MTMNQRKFTEEDLKQYNGQNGSPVYIAFKGIVYDVSRSYHWQNGRHWVLHSAGTDLTAELEQAPHSADLIEAFPVVGELIEK